MIIILLLFFQLVGVVILCLLVSCSELIIWRILLKLCLVFVGQVMIRCIFLFGLMMNSECMVSVLLVFGWIRLQSLEILWLVLVMIGKLIWVFWVLLILLIYFRCDFIGFIDSVRILILCWVNWFLSLVVKFSLVVYIGVKLVGWENSMFQLLFSYLWRWMCFLLEFCLKLGVMLLSLRFMGLFFVCVGVYYV